MLPGQHHWQSFAITQQVGILPSDDSESCSNLMTGRYDMPMHELVTVIALSITHCINEVL